MKFTPEQLEKAKAAKNAEELFALAKGNGITLTEEEAKKYYDEWHKEGELADNELANVSGGGCVDDFYDWLKSVEVSYNPAFGKYFCPNCDDGNHMLSYYGYEYCDSGNYDKYKCEHCGKWYKHITSGDKCGKWFEY